MQAADCIHLYSAWLFSVGFGQNQFKYIYSKFLRTIYIFIVPIGLDTKASGSNKEQIIRYPGFVWTR